MTGDVAAVIVAGVSGSGKSTVGKALAATLGWSYVEADDHHPPANVAKMARGEPLDDRDRAPWLASLRSELVRHGASGTPVVVSCSALKRRYRTILTTGVPRVETVLLHGTPELLEQRLSQRTGHFFRPALLRSQLDALEWPGPDERVTPLSIDATPEELVARIVEHLDLDRTVSPSRPETAEGGTP